MIRTCRMRAILVLVVTYSAPWAVQGQDTRQTDTYRRIKSAIDAIPVIDTHSHLAPFSRQAAAVVTADGAGMNLCGIWARSYFPQIKPLPPWKKGMAFDAWWGKARKVFGDGRATSFYRYLLPAFQDLYGVDFDTITDDQARDLDARIFRNYRDRGREWVYQVITERANTELIVNDPHWRRISEVPEYPFCALVFNVTTLISGFPGKPTQAEGDDPYLFAQKHGIEVKNLDDYLQLLDTLFQERKAAGAVCIKSSIAYKRTLQFDRVPRERAEAVFGKSTEAVTPEQVKDFEDFILWHLVELAAKYDLPFQIHTGHGRVQGSNPILLVDLIQANPKTKFILFHGGYPWIGETAVIAMRHRNVWVDSCWMPTLSYTMAKQAYHAWLDAMASDRLLWGSDSSTAEAIYGATCTTRQCLAEVLAERVDRGDLREEDALHIARQILRDNALKLMPSLKAKLWKHTGKGLTPPTASKPAASSRRSLPQ